MHDHMNVKKQQTYDEKTCTVQECVLYEGYGDLCLGRKAASVWYWAPTPF